MQEMCSAMDAYHKANPCVQSAPFQTHLLYFHVLFSLIWSERLDVRRPSSADLLGLLLADSHLLVVEPQFPAAVARHAYLASRVHTAAAKIHG